jgi:transketolase
MVFILTVVIKCGLSCSTGSLGHGLPIALGMALADRSRNVYCLISDGELAEGSIYEAYRVKWDYKVDNLKIYINHNGWGAYRTAEVYDFFADDSDTVVVKTNSDQLSFLKGQDAHYHVMTEQEYKKGLKELL